METSTITPNTIVDVVKCVVSTVPAVELALNPDFFDNQEICRFLTIPELTDELARSGGTVHDNMDDTVHEVWKQLFVHRTPVSESCRRVLTLLNKLGFRDHVQTRNLAGILAEAKAMGAAAWRDKTLQLARLQHAVRAIDITSNLDTVDLPPQTPYAAVVPAHAHTDAIQACIQSRGGQRPHHVRLHLGDDDENVEQKISGAAAAAPGCPLWVVLQPGAAFTARLGAALRGLAVPLWISCNTADLGRVRALHPAAVPINVCAESSEIYAFIRRCMELWGQSFVMYASVWSPTLEHAVAARCHARAALARALSERYRCLLYAGWNLSASEIAEDVTHMSGGCTCAV